MPWLEVDDYPKMVAASDLGVCLHYSSSGLDLPMKVVDMFSAGLPCLAKDYMAVGELVQDKVNGRLFKTSAELAH
jgi:beta-1,4-mannosyltransferase